MGSEMLCQQCKSKNTDNSQFCSTCGASLQQAANFGPRKSHADLAKHVETFIVETYCVVVEGNCIEGFEFNLVVPQLAKLTRQSEASAQRLLAGIETKVKSGLDLASGERYLAALRNIGVASRLNAENSSIEANLPKALAVEKNVHLASPTTPTPALDTVSTPPARKPKISGVYVFAAAVLGGIALLVLISEAQDWSGGAKTTSIPVAQASPATQTSLLTAFKSAAPGESQPIPIPAFASGESYTEVRKKMMADGWAPFHSIDADTCVDGDARCKNRPEMQACSSSGLANCKFLWKKREKTLAIITVGDGDAQFESASFVEKPSGDGAMNIAPVAFDGVYYCTYGLREGAVESFVAYEKDSFLEFSGSAVNGRTLFIFARMGRWRQQGDLVTYTQLFVKGGLNNNWRKYSRAIDWDMHVDPQGTNKFASTKVAQRSDGKPEDASEEDITYCERMNDKDAEIQRRAMVDGRPPFF